jgi:hypothetical protein
VSRPLRLLFCLVVVLARASLVAAAPATAGSDAEQSALCTAAEQSAERQHGTPAGLLEAIAKAETGRPIPPTGMVGPWPWSVNVDGAGIFFASKEQAVAWTRNAMAQGATFTDVGCMQVDLRYHPSAFRSLDEAFDPAANADYAARFLLSLHDMAGGNWYLAAGMYHSRSPVLASLYRERINAVGNGQQTWVRPEKLRLVLAGGGVMVINVNRQPARRPRHLTACQVAAILGPYLRSTARPKGC